jgi:cytochrome c-type biogenesis protein CcmH
MPESPGIRAAGRARAVLAVTTLLANAVVVVVLLQAAAAQAQSLDDRVYAIARQLMCPVCAGQTVAESDSTVAGEMRAIIREKLVAGESPDRILAYFVSQFGESILAEPPRRGVSLVLYLGPVVALVVGLATAGVLIRRWAARPRVPAAGIPGPPPDARELERLESELGARDR